MMMSIEFKYEFTGLDGQLISEVSHKCHDESLPEIMQCFRQFLLGVGFHPNTVEQHIEAD